MRRVFSHKKHDSAGHDPPDLLKGAQALDPGFSWLAWQVRLVELPLNRLASIGLDLRYSPQELVSTFGAVGHEDLDHGGLAARNYSYCTGFFHEPADKKVEVEVRDGDVRDLDRARGHLKLMHFVVTGYGLVVNACLYSLAVLAGLLPMASPVDRMIGKVATVAAVGLLQVALISKAMQVVCRTKLDGRLFVRFLYQCGGSQHRVALLFHSLAAGFGISTRVLFVVDAVMGTLPFQAELEDKWARLWPLWGAMGMTFARTAGASLLFGPILFKWMTRAYCNARIAEMLKDPSPGEDGTRVLRCMDDYETLAGMSLLHPVSHLFKCAAIPSRWEDVNDAMQMWRHLKFAVRDGVLLGTVDGFVSLCLQMFQLSLTYEELSGPLKLYTYFSIFVTWVSALGMAMGLCLKARMITVLAGSFLGAQCLFILLKAVGIAACQGHVLHTLRMSCEK